MSRITKNFTTCLFKKLSEQSVSRQLCERETFRPAGRNVGFLKRYVLKFLFLVLSHRQLCVYAFDEIKYNRHDDEERRTTNGKRCIAGS